MIRIEGLHKRLAGEPVLRGVDLEIRRGEIVALVGPSGTGKSVLLKHIVGLLSPDRGDVLVGGESVGRAGDRQLASLRRRIGYVFQDAALLDSLTVRENLRLALDDDLCGRDTTLAPTRIGEAMRLVNLHPRVLDRRPSELSGGMRKRAGVARAIINFPEVLLYDEPSTGLDPQNVETINALILEARERTGATSLVITHDLASIERIADRVVLLLGGRVHFDGTSDGFFASADPAVRAFIGRATATDELEMVSWLPIAAGGAN